MHESVLRRFVPQLCTKTPDKQIQTVEEAFSRRQIKRFPDFSFYGTGLKFSFLDSFQSRGDSPILRLK